MRTWEPLELKILYLVRQKARDFESILVGLGVSDRSYISVWYSVVDALVHLRELGLIEAVDALVHLKELGLIDIQTHTPLNDDT